MAGTEQSFAVTIAGREISRANYREIQRDRYYRRTEKTFNTVFYKKHFEAEEGEFDLLAYLVKMAKIYDVPPAAVLGGIMGEHSMNQRGTFKQAGESGINLIGKKVRQDRRGRCEQIKPEISGSERGGILRSRADSAVYCLGDAGGDQENPPRRGGGRARQIQLERRDQHHLRLHELCRELV
jgi:hypothetical protein